MLPPWTWKSVQLRKPLGCVWLLGKHYKELSFMIPLILPTFLELYMYLWPLPETQDYMDLKLLLCPFLKNNNMLMFVSWLPFTFTFSLLWKYTWICI